MVRSENNSGGKLEPSRLRFATCLTRAAVKHQIDFQIVQHKPYKPSKLPSSLECKDVLPTPNQGFGRWQFLRTRVLSLLG